MVFIVPTAQFYLTNAGRAAAYEAETHSINVQITDVAFGTAKYDAQVAAPAKTALTTEVARFPLIGGGINNGVLRFTTIFTPTISADAFEIGLFLNDGTLFAVAAITGTEPLLQLVNGITGIITLGVALADIGSNITVSVDANSPIAVVLMNQHIENSDPHPQYLKKVTTITAGAGLTGGGDLSGNRTITLGTPSTITSWSGNEVSGSTHTHELGDGAVTNAKLANGAVDTINIAQGAIINAHIGNGSVDTSKLADSAVTNAKIADGAVNVNKIANGAVISAKIADGAVDTIKINNGAVTDAKIVSMSASKITGVIPSENLPPASAPVNVVDNLTSNSVNDALSANQGRVLNEAKFDKAGGAISGDVNIAGSLEIAGLLASATLNSTLGGTIIDTLFGKLTLTNIPNGGGISQVFNTTADRYQFDKPIYAPNLNPIGVGQTWQDVTASRAFGTTYTNDTSKPIQVSCAVHGYELQGPGEYVAAEVDSVLVQKDYGHSTGGGYYGTYNFSFIVPVGSTYQIFGNVRDILYWSELR